MYLFSFAVKSKLIQFNFMQKHKASSCVSTYLIFEEVDFFILWWYKALVLGHCSLSKTGMVRSWMAIGRKNPLEKVRSLGECSENRLMPHHIAPFKSKEDDYTRKALREKDKR